MSAAPEVPPGPPAASPPRTPLHTSSPISLLPSCRSLKQGLQIHAQLLLRGLPRSNKLALHKLLSFFALSGSPAGLAHACLISSQIPNPDAFVYNTIIRAHSRGSGSTEEAMTVYKSMVSDSGNSPNNFTFLFLLDCCAKLRNPELGRQIHSQIIKGGFELEIFVGNSLIHLYHCLRDLESARQLFNTSPTRDVVSYNTIISGCARQGRAADALEHFKEMLVSGVEPDERTFVHLLAVCSVLGPTFGKLIHQMVYKNMHFYGSDTMLNSALVYMYAKCRLMDMADRVFSMSTHKSTITYSSMISGYANCEDINNARRLFDEMPEKDLVSWTSMISGYSRAGMYKKALEVYQEMEKAGVEADEVTMVVVLSACAQLGALGLGRKLHQDIERKGSFGPNPILVAAIVDMYAKCGCIATALDIFSGVDEKLKTVSVFNSMISGLAQHGLGEKALEIFEGMQSVGLNLDEITFVGVLHACAHSGLIDEGREIFDSMVKRFQIKQQIEHYGCMVNLLCRGGLLEEAYDFIEKMPMIATPNIWVSLLGACTAHRKMKMADTCRMRLLEIKSNQKAEHLPLSSIFANKKRWELYREVRKSMNCSSTPKPKGWSYIEWDGTLHQFLAYDRSHPQANEIHFKLEEMRGRLRSYTCDAHSEEQLFDVEDEEKDSTASHHSEKLALAFGLINMGPETRIQIIKNLRMCCNCHLSFKLLSEIYDREIVVRDRVRFHRMENGLCSCGD